MDRGKHPFAVFGLHHTHAISILQFFWCFAAMVLLLFVSVSAPVWHHVYFLKAFANNSEIRYGIWGYCTKAATSGWQCGDASLGYGLNLNPIGLE